MAHTKLKMNCLYVKEKKKKKKNAFHSLIKTKKKIAMECCEGGSCLEAMTGKKNEKFKKKIQIITFFFFFFSFYKTLANHSPSQ